MRTNSDGEIATKYCCINNQVPKYAPHFQGLMTTAASVKYIIPVNKKPSLTNGDGDSFVSYLETKQWL